MAIVSQWLLNDASNTNAADAVGGNTLTRGNTTTSVPGLFGTAISCALDSYFRTTTNSNLNPATNMDLKVWVKLTDTSNTQYIMKHDGGATGYYIRFTNNDTTNLFMQDIYSGGTRTVSFPRSTVETGKWVLIGMTTIGTTTTSYYNGVPQVTVTSGSNRGSSTGNFNLNGYDTAGSNNVHGVIDNAMVANTGRTNAQWKNEYAYGKGFF